MKNEKHGILKSFGFAIRGCRMLFSSERNARIHLAILALVVFSGILLHISAVEWVIITMVSGAVLAAEAINTAIEEMINLLHPERSEKAGRIKDLSAGAVFFVSLAALICGLIIFVPRIIALFHS
ncbi:MAG TPA: diacylglycerol kinase family protein [Bacteroidia bacterium]|nr:diacylglycerol kinase family protein [Bacteroidia bacterium]